MRFGWMLFLLVMFVPIDSMARLQRMQQSAYVFEGPLLLEKVKEMTDQIMNNQEAQKIVFKNSVGSPAGAGLILDRFEERMVAQHLKTVASGYCSSTCAYAFLFGSVRSLRKSDTQDRTYLMLHAFRDNRSREVNYGLTDRNFQRIVKKSGGKFPLSLLELIYDDRAGTGDGELYIFREAFKSKRGSSHVLLCRDPKAPNFDQCEPIFGYSLESLGIDIEEESNMP